MNIFNPGRLKKPPKNFEFNIGYIGTTLYLLRIGDEIVNNDKTVIDWGDGTQINYSNNSTVNKTYTSPYLYPVLKNISFTGRESTWRRINAITMYGNSTFQSNRFDSIDFDNIKEINNLYLRYTNEGEILDFSNIKKIYGTFRINYFSQLNTIIFPNKIYGFKKPLTYLNISNCESLLDINMSGFSMIENVLIINNNNSLTGVTFPTVIDENSDNITIFQIYSNSLITDLDLSMFTKLGGNIRLNSNNSLTGITFPDQLDENTDNITIFNCYSNPLITYLDLSVFTKLGGNIRLNSNNSLTDITFPTLIDENSNNIIDFLFYSNPLITSLDLSVFTKLGGDIRLDSNNSLTGITFPDQLDENTDNITIFYCYSNPLITNLDLSMFTKLGGNIRLNSNNSLTGITFPDQLDENTDNISYFYANSNPLITSLDLSMFTKLGGQIYLGSNNSLTGITFPTLIDENSNNITDFYANLNPLITSLDLSMFKKLGGRIYLNSNDSLTGITFPTEILSLTNRISILHIYNCPNIVNLDFSSLINIGDSNSSFLFYNNSLLESITMNNDTVNNYPQYTVRIYNNPELLSIDISGFNRLYRYLEIRDNIKLNEIILTSNNLYTNSTSDWEIYNNNIQYLDISGIHNISNEIRISDNPNLTGITFTNNSISTVGIRTFNLSNNDLQFLNLSGVTNFHNRIFNSTFTLNNNPNLETIILSDIYGTSGLGTPYDCFGRYVYLTNCSINQSTIDDFILKMKNFYTNNNPYSSSLFLYMQGINNNEPSLTGLTHIQELNDIIESYGKTINIVYNDPIYLEIKNAGNFMKGLMVGYSIMPEYDNPIWDMGDGNTRTFVNTSFSYNYSAPWLSPVEKTITFNSLVKKHVNLFRCIGSTSAYNVLNSINISDIIKLNDFNISYTNNLGLIDLSNINDISGTITINFNNNLTGITFSNNIDTSSSNIITFNINNNPLLEHLDLSSLFNLSANILISNNNSLTGITFSSGTTLSDNTILYINNNSDLVYLDLSFFNKYYSRYELQNNTSLSAITFNESMDNTLTGNIQYMDFRNDSSLIEIDLSAMLKFRWNVTSPSGSYNLNTTNCTSLTTIYFPSVINNDGNYAYMGGYIRSQNCALSLSTINDLLNKIKQHSLAITPFGNYLVIIDGGTNHYPRQTELDLISDIQTLFTNAGRTFTINYNNPLININLSSDDPSGSANTNPSNIATIGSTVTINLTFDDLIYEISLIEVIGDITSNSISLTQLNNKEYTFTMPDETVNININITTI